MNILKKDVRQEKGEWMWFVASAKWNVSVRGVLYSQGKVLVPLLPDEVPFSYDDVKRDVVFLWDPATGMALATDRRKAVVVKAPVAQGDSAVALYGEPPRDQGYCYRLVTGEQLDLGQYPTVVELARHGVTDRPGVTYELQAPGVYHCARGVTGVEFGQLPSDAVVGGSAVLAGYMLLGVTAAAYLSVKGVRPLFDSMCVAGAGVLNLSVAPEKVPPGADVRQVRWFGHRALEPGLYLNMGVVQVVAPEKLLPVDLAVPVPADAKGVLYWLSADDGNLRTRAGYSGSSTVGIGTGPGLVGLYVYVITQLPLPDTSPHDLKYMLYAHGSGGVVEYEDDPWYE